MSINGPAIDKAIISEEDAARVHREKEKDSRAAGFRTAKRVGARPPKGTKPKVRKWSIRP